MSNTGRSSPSRVPGWRTTHCSWRSRMRTAGLPGPTGRAGRRCAIPRRSNAGGPSWPGGVGGAALRDPAALERWSSQLAGEVEHYRREQALFFAQFRALKAACGERGIRLMGDVPIYVAHDSADVGANRGQFRLDEGGRLLVQAGVPPDYFSATGQLWGNHIFDWARQPPQGY